MHQTRKRILDYFDQHGTASARQLAKAFGLTAANLRHHLDILQTEGKVIAVGHRFAESRGRPEQIFGLAQLETSSLEPLTRALLTTLRSTDQPKAEENRQKEVAENLVGDWIASTGSITQRLVAAVRALEPLGYKPRWEARSQGPQLVLGRCPYAAIIADHPELCRIDASVLEKLLDCPVDQTAKLQPGPQMIPQCIFVMSGKNN